MLTQWRVASSGVIGLDYAALPVVMDMLGVTSSERGSIFEDLRVMEAEALKVINK